MSQLNNSSVVGPHAVAPSAADLVILRNYDMALGSPPRSQYAQFPASFYEMFFMIATDPNNTTKDSLIRKAPWPLKIWAADLGCESAAGSAATADIMTGTSSPVSIFDAASDIKTTAGPA